MCEGPNIIVFLVDDQAWAGTSINKYQPYRADSRSDYFEMPNLERLAGEGVRFTDAYAPAPLCAPARVSILLGVSPVALRATTFCGMRRDGAIAQKRLPHQLAIPEVIKRGRPEYVTAHFGKWHIYGHSPGEVGYDESDGPTGNADGRHHGAWDEPLQEDPKRIFEITEHAERFIETQASAQRPFFMQVSHYALHVPVECRAEPCKRFAAKRPGWKDSMPEYAAMTADLDESLGRIMDTVDRTGIAERTYIFYLSDNGGNACDHVSLTNLNLPLRKGKQFLHEGGIRIPFVVRGPDVPADSVCLEPAISYDLLPTFADLLGISDLPEGIEGTSLRPVLEGPLPALHRATEPAPLPPVLQRDRDFFVWHAPYRVPGFSYYRESAIRRGKHKLLKNWDGDFVELYDLDVDLEERVNLAHQKPQLAQELERLLLDYLRDVNAEVDVAPFNEKLWRKWQEDDSSLHA
jgi:arylsulfatase A-like enzyme